jgi:hypothetical protein
MHYHCWLMAGNIMAVVTVASSHGWWEGGFTHQNNTIEDYNYMIVHLSLLSIESAKASDRSKSPFNSVAY